MSNRIYRGSEPVSGKTTPFRGNEDEDHVGNQVDLGEILNKPWHMGQDDEVLVVGIDSIFESQYNRSYYTRLTMTDGKLCQVLLNQELIKQIHEILSNGDWAYISKKPAGKFAQRTITSVKPEKQE